MSNALFDAMPATEPIVVPAIPGLGTPSHFLPGSSSAPCWNRGTPGTVSGFYALLPGGVQKITAFVADLLRTAVTQTSNAPQLVSPDKLIDIPDIDALNVGFYPAGKLNFVDTEANPVTCVGWEKLSTDPQAAIAVITGKGCRSRRHGPAPGRWFATTAPRNPSRPTRRWCCPGRRTSSLPPAASPLG